MSKTATQRKHIPLEDDITSASGRLRTKAVTGKRKSRSQDPSGQNGDGYIDARSSRRILAISQDLADEDDADQQARARAAKRASTENSAFGFDSRFGGFDEEDGNETAAPYNDEDEEDWLPEEGTEQDEEEVDPEDMAVYEKFLRNGEELANFAPSMAGLTTADKSVTTTRKAQGITVEEDEEQEGGGQTTNLADLILQRIAEKEALEAVTHQDSADSAQQQKQFYGGGDPSEAVEIPAKVVDTFTKVGLLLSRYKSGPLPKPFKVLPTLPQWPDLLSITRPESWTPHAVFRATKIFISAPQSVGQHFCSTILLDRVRDDIQEHKKLNPHLYEALMASFYRPAAFFKGFLFPLVEAGCTLREAQIISSVLTKHKIPVLHSAAALLRLCEISAEQTFSINSEAAGAANIFIRALLAKKYALPYKVVDGLVFHFLRFRASKGNAGSDASMAALGSKEAKLPVLWHQSLLIFAQTYRNEITEDQREALLDLLLVRGHKDIGPEVRRELLAGRNRAGEGQNGDAVMTMNGTNGNLVSSGTINDGRSRDDGDDTMDFAVG